MLFTNDSLRPVAAVRALAADTCFAAIAVSRKLRMSGGFLNRKFSSAKSAEGEDDTGDGERKLRAQSSELQVAC